MSKEPFARLEESLDDITTACDIMVSALKRIQKLEYMPGLETAEQYAKRQATEALEEVNQRMKRSIERNRS